MVLWLVMVLCSDGVVVNDGVVLQFGDADVVLLWCCGLLMVLYMWCWCSDGVVVW